MPAKLKTSSKSERHSVDRGCRDNRVRDWLASSYDDDEWVLRGSVGVKSEVSVSFRVVMPDGRLLIDHPKLYATVKEFAFWIRAANYARMEDERTHASYINASIRICIAIINLGFSSFSELDRSDVNDICEAASQGAANLMGVGERLGSYLAKYETWDHVPDDEKIVRRQWSAENKLTVVNTFNRKRVLEACNLPTMLARPTTKREIAAATARLNDTTIAVVRSRRKYETITRPTIFYVTGTFEALYRLRHHMDAPALMFLPFPEGACAKAEELGSATEVTPIVPPELMMRLLGATIRFLTDRADEIVETHRRAAVNRQSAGSYDNDFAVHARREATTLITACFIIIAAFTARRSEEINMMERNCLHVDESGGWWARVYIEKSTREQTWIPVPRIVAVAVGTIKRLSEEGGENEEGLLFRYYDPVLGREVGTWSERKVDAFAELVGAKSYENHEKQADVWPWQPRQFRRFFAVLFFYRYRGKKESLAHHLRHFSMATTSGYLRLDPVLDKIWLQEMQQFRRTVVLEIVEGTREFTGPMGKRIKNEAARLRGIFSKSITIVPERLASMVLKRLDRNNVLLTPWAWATCGCPNSKGGANRAACQRASVQGVTGIGPSMKDAGPSICPSCPWALLDQDNLAFMDEELAELRASNDNQAPSIFAELQAEGLIALHYHRAAEIA